MTEADLLNFGGRFAVGFTGGVATGWANARLADRLIVGGEEQEGHALKGLAVAGLGGAAAGAALTRLSPEGMGFFAGHELTLAVSLLAMRRRAADDDTAESDIITDKGEATADWLGKHYAALRQSEVAQAYEKLGMNVTVGYTVRQEGKAHVVQIVDKVED